MRRSDAERLKKIVSTYQALHRQLEERGITRASLMEDEFSQWAVTTPLYNIGEQAYCLSRELKEQHPAVPWSAIAGIRHRLVHDYEGVNWSVLVEVIYDELPAFIEMVGDILGAMEA